MSFPLRARTIVQPATLISLIALICAVFAVRATAHSVTLISFSATSLSGQPEIYVEWETATEFDTVGFFMTRSNSAQGPYTRVSEFIPHEGDTVVGAQYDWVDETTILGQTYYYRLEEITTTAISVFYGPIPATAGSPTPVLPLQTYLPLIARTS